MNARVVLKSGALIAALVLAGCGGGDDPPASGSGSTPTPAPAPAPVGIDPGTPSPAPAPAPTPGSSGGTIPALSAISAGDANGGTASNTPSGYLDTLLSGRWAFSQDAAGSCLSIPTGICGSTPISFSFGQGFVASGLQATRIGEGRYYSGEACQAGNLVASGSYSEDITFQPSDTLVDDAASPGLQIAVRRGVATNFNANFTQGDSAAIANLFSSCPTFNPDPSTEPTPPTPEACTDWIQLRIEVGASGPLLLTDEDSTCEPGTVAPAAAFRDTWNLDQATDGMPKLP